MNATVILVGGIVIYFLAYRIYGKYLARRIFKLDPDAPVPSKTMADGVDYVPTHGAGGWPPEDRPLTIPSSRRFVFGKMAG